MTHRSIQLSLRSALLMLVPAPLLLSARPSSAQNDAQRATLHAVRAPQYPPPATIREGKVRTPSALTRRVAVHRSDALLQEVLMAIATQAGLGLSYGEDLVQA